MWSISMVIAQESISQFQDNEVIFTCDVQKQSFRIAYFLKKHLVVRSHLFYRKFSPTRSEKLICEGIHRCAEGPHLSFE